MKWSRYNTIVESEDNKFLIYNCASKNIMVIVSEIKDLINENMSDIAQIEAIYPDLYKHLSDNAFIVEANCDEVQVAIENMKRESNNHRYFELIINPTLNCNLRCWYCYEMLIPDSQITPIIMDSLRSLIRSKVESTELQKLKLSFFGGEPLLRARKTILPLVGYAKEMCDLNRKKMSVGFTTNGVLLTPKLTDEFYSMGVSMNFQIPFDGNELLHNKVKKFANGRGTYNKVINNVKYALEMGFGFNIRCNYTKENVSSFKDLICEFHEAAANYPNKLAFSFQKVWQATEDNGTLDTLEELQTMASEIDTDSSSSYHSLFSPCYADMENSVVVNYNGNIYNCTARDFKPEDREGVLAPDGTIIYNQKHADRMSAKFGNETCLRCTIFPICDICSQKKLDNVNIGNLCLRGADKHDMEKLLSRHIELIADRKINNQALS